MANFAGTAGPDDFTGTPESDLMQGEAGDDILRGREGDDFLHGGTGSDELRGGLGNDLVSGDDGNDYLYGGRGNDVLWGGFGDDEMRGGSGDDVFNDGFGDDWAYGGDGNDVFYSLDGDDVLLGGAGNDDFTIVRAISSAPLYIWLDGGDGDDRFDIEVQRSGLIEIATGSGSDSVEINLLTDHLTVFFNPDGTDTVTLGRNMAGFHSDTTVTLEGFGRGDDGGVIVWDEFLAHALTGWDGSVNPFGSAGYARIHTREGRQILQIDRDGGGDEWLWVMDLGEGSAMAFTAHNFDGFSPDGSPAEGLFLNGTPGPDELVGRNGSDTITAHGGDDRIYGRAGSDSIAAGAGDDLVEGGAGADLIDGAEGDDFLYGGHGHDVVHGGAGNDWLDENSLSGGSGRGELYGDAGDDTLILFRYGAGPAYYHVLSGGEGNDLIHAGLAHGGTLIIDGGAGDDRVWLAAQDRGAGAIVTLGAGSDVIEIDGGMLDPSDSSLTITDFAAGAAGDRFEFSGLEWLLAGDWEAGTLFESGHFGLVPTAGGTLLLGDRDGGGDDFVTLAALDGVTLLALTAANLGGNAPPITYFTAGNDQITGSAGTDLLSGLGGADTFRLYQGGDDAVAGGEGADLFYFGAALTAADHVDGGAGVDTLILQGNYAGGLVLGAFVTAIENISILGGNNTNFGEPGTNRYDYVLTTRDSNFAAGVQARINGSALLAGEDFTFDGSAETDASFVVYGGKGKDTLKGGLGNDIFFYAEDRFASGDTVNGGAGYDGMFLRGNYTIDFNAPGYTGLFTNIENLTLTSATDERYARGGGTEFDYNLTLSDSIVGAGQELTISGALLTATETMILDGSRETNGAFRLFGGKAGDTLKGGAFADLLHGNMGADLLSGGGGGDIFRYQAVTESYSVARDHIIDFTPGTDKIDLAAIDANDRVGGDQAFAWIGSNAFSNQAGQLRATQQGGQWIVEGDINGDGYADLIIALTLQGPTPLGAGDFVL